MEPTTTATALAAAIHRADTRAAEEQVAEGGDLPPFLGVPIPVEELTTAAG